MFPTSQRPVDIFESDFIIQTFAPFVRGCKDSCEDYGYLLGALALSATGVCDTIDIDVDRLIQNMNRLNEHSRCSSLA